MRLTVWDAYRLAMRTKTGGDGSFRDVARWALRNRCRPSRLSWLFTPIDFLRYREFDFALRAISAAPRPLRRALDLSSPKLLPLTIARHFPQSQVVSTDVLQRECDWVSQKSTALGLTNLAVKQQDARQLDFPDAYFDLITSISVFEHIAPEIDGDRPAIAELARVLAPGGTAILTVPCSRSYLADYVSHDVYERSSDGRPTFFQRFYTREMLRDRFEHSPQLNLQSISFVDEQYGSRNPRRRIAHWVNCSPMQNRVFGPMFPLLSHLFLSPPRPWEKCRKPYIACLVLKQPAADSAHFASRRAIAA